MNWLFFGIGVFVGGIIGVTAMCVFFVSGEESRREERREQKSC